MDLWKELLTAKNDDSKQDGLPQKEVGGVMGSLEGIEVDQGDPGHRRKPEMIRIMIREGVARATVARTPPG